MDFKNHGQTEVLNWLEFVLERAKHYAPKQKFTIGWSDPSHASLLVENLNWVSFHYYKSPDEFVQDYAELKEKVGVKPITLTEFGQSSFNAYWYPFSKNEMAQLYYYQRMFQAFEKAEMPHFLHWTLYDFDHIPDEVVGTIPWRKEVQKEYGFIDQDGSKKPAFKIISGNFENTSPPKLYERMSRFQWLFIFLMLPFIFGIYQLNKKSKHKNTLAYKFIKKFKK